MRPAALAAGLLLIVLYGSLYPFRFEASHHTAGALRALLATWRSLDSRGDLLANILLYVPLGFFSTQALGHRPRSLRVLLVAFPAFLLSFTIELLQQYDVHRLSQMSDVYGNSAGAFLGALAGVSLPCAGKRREAGWIEWRPFVLLLVGCWVGYRLFPYLPSLEIHKYQDALRPLFEISPMQFSDLYEQTAGWLAVAMMLDALFGTIRGRIALLIMIAAVLLGRVLIMGIVLSREELTGALLAVVLWTVVLSHMRVRALVVLVLFMVMIGVEALEPFQFHAAAIPFGWIPFRSFINAPRGGATRVFFEKAFWYGALVWLMIQAGAGWKPATASSALLVLALRIAQTHLPGRSAEVTDAVMVVMLAGVMKLMDEQPAQAVTTP